MIAKGQQQCPFANCAERIIPQVASMINVMVYEMDIIEQRSDCNHCGLPKRNMKSLYKHSCSILACLTCWRKSWETKKRLECLSCEEKTTLEDQQEMIVFMSDTTLELTFHQCGLCLEVFLQTCTKKLTECSHFVCSMCLVQHLYLKIGTTKKWQSLNCPVSHCRKALHYNDIRESVDKETFRGFEEKVDEEFCRKQNKSWWRPFK